MGWSAAAVAGSSLISGAMGASASRSAASTQANAARDAAAMQMEQYRWTRADLEPWRVAGRQAISPLFTYAGLHDGWDFTQSPLLRQPAQFNNTYNPTGDYSPNQLFTPFNPDDLESTPGYQFIRNQGLKATQGGYAARGLGRSGAAVQGAADYASNLASTTYNDQLKNYLTQFQMGQDAGVQNFSTLLAGRSGNLQNLMANYNTGLQGDLAGRNQLYNTLMGISGMGQNAATQTGQFGQAAAQTAGNNLVAAGQASAAGTIGAANAWGGALSNMSNALLMSRLFPG